MPNPPTTDQLSGWLGITTSQFPIGDQFLRTLGLPPCNELDDPILSQFELIDQRLLRRREELAFCGQCWRIEHINP